MTSSLFIVISAEFRSYFDHVRSLHFDDRPDYDYLKRMFRELFFRKGFRYDNLYDWDLSERDKMAPEFTTGVEHIEPALRTNLGDTGLTSHEKEDSNQNLKKSGSLNAGDTVSKKSDVKLGVVVSRGGERSTQGGSSQHGLEQNTNQSRGNSHGYHTRTASNAMR